MSGKKTAIITGASGGIGGGLVEGFLGEGYNVVATSRNANRTLTTSSSLVLVDGDIGKQQTADDAVDAAVKNFGTVDVLVNNAGIFLNKPFLEFTIERLRRPCIHQSAWILLHHSAHRERDAETKIGMRCEHHCGACRSANRRRKWFVSMITKGGLNSATHESRNRVCQGRHSL